MLFPQLPFQTTMFQHERLVRCWVQKSQTQLQIHPFIIVEMKWEQVQDDGIGIGKISWWLSSLLFCPEPNGQKIVVWNQWHRPDPGGKVRQPKLLRMIKWYKMAKPCCFTLNESDGNSSVCSIPNDAAAKSSAGRAEALPLFESAWWHFQMSGPVGVLLRWTEIEFFKFKRI